MAPLLHDRRGRATTTTTATATTLRSLALWLVSPTARTKAMELQPDGEAQHILLLGRVLGEEAQDGALQMHRVRVGGAPAQKLRDDVGVRQAFERNQIHCDEPSCHPLAPQLLVCRAAQQGL